MIQSEIAPNISDKLFSSFKLVGEPVAGLVTYIGSKHPSWGWRLSLGAVAVFLIPVLLAAILLLTTRDNFVAQPIETVVYRELLKPKSRPPILITLVSGSVSLFSAIVVIQYYGPLLLEGSSFSEQSRFIIPPAISSVKFCFRLLYTRLIKIFGRRWLLILATFAKLVAEVILSLDFAKNVGIYYLYRSQLLFFIVGGGYVGGDGFLTAPTGWLDVSFSKEAELAGLIVKEVQGLIQKAIIACVSTLGMCKLQTRVFIPYIVWDILVAGFIVLFVPETTNIKKDEIVQKVWSRHWFWKRYLSTKDLYT